MNESFKVFQFSCPLCGADIYDEYVENDLVHIPICVQCATQLAYLMNSEKRLNTILLDKLETFTGMSYAECKNKWHQGNRKHIKEREQEKQNEA
jgi:hypothetical protein